MTAACLLVRSPACSARQLQTSIVQVVHLCPTGFRKEPCERLERHKPKGLRVVLRGLGSSNAPRLPGAQWDIVNCLHRVGGIGRPRQTAHLARNAFTIHDVPLGLTQLRVSRTFLDQLHPQLFRPWIPNSIRCQHLPSSLGRFLAA